MHCSAAALPLRDAHDPPDYLEHASNGEHHGQPSEQNGHWHQQCDAGRTSERHETLKEGSVSVARARHVKDIGRDCSCGGCNICHRPGSISITCVNHDSS
jgi:hypothetical protein